MTALGYPTYLVDYGPISFEDRALGLEHWIEDVLPSAIRTVSEHAGGARVHTIAWSLGGVMTPLAAAAQPDLPLASMSLVGSPFDFERVRLLAPIRALARLTRGAFVTSLYRMLGGAPAPLVSLGFQATAIQRLIGRPLFLARNLDDRETLAHVQAVDDYMANMFAYPGRTFGQLYHRFFFVNDLVDGRLELTDHEIDLSACRIPVLAVASPDDLLAPEDACFAVKDLLPDVRLETAPGGHLGVLTGRSAKDTTWAHLDQFIALNEPRTRVADTLL
jgi:polyhydroxyalkanoate synthase